MAFWKKSDDPWDIAPEKRKKPQAVSWEQDAEEEQGADVSAPENGKVKLPEASLDDGERPDGAYPADV